MTINWKSAVIGGVSGAALAIAVVLGLARSGLLMPDSGTTIHDYLMDHPELVFAMANKAQNQQQQADDDARQAAVDKLGVKAFFDPKVAFITGPKDAKTTFVEFFDYNCPYCRASNPTVEAYYEKHKNDTRFAFIEFPIKGQNSIDVTKIALAARKQPDKYLAFHFALMREQTEATPQMAVEIAKKVGLDLEKLEADTNDPAVTSAIAASHALAQAANIDGTPAFIIDGKMREGALDDASLKEMLGTGKPDKKS